jgi:predicted enzyme related to lactoylglutathione lyase
MQPHISVITLGVADFDRAKRFYGDGLGWTAVQDYPGWVAYELNGGAVALGLHAREQLAADAGIDPAGSRVAGVLAEAEGAGGTVVQPATASPWGGTTGHFTDPDGYLWKVAAGNGPQPFAAE